MYVKFRPYLKDFLEFIASRFELIVFCKGSELCYKPILDYLEANMKYFSHRLYGNYVLFDNQYSSVKYYDFLLTYGRTKENTIIVDSGVNTYCLNLYNGIPTSSFINQHDVELISLAKYLEEIKEVANVEKHIRSTIEKCGVFINGT